jgi:hypothetical protein
MTIMQEYAHRSSVSPCLHVKNKKIDEVSKMNYRWKRLAEETIRINRILNRNMKFKDKFLKTLFKWV